MNQNRPGWTVTHCHTSPRLQKAYGSPLKPAGQRHSACLPCGVHSAPAPHGSGLHGSGSSTQPDSQAWDVASLTLAHRFRSLLTSHRVCFLPQGLGEQGSGGEVLASNPSTPCGSPESGREKESRQACIQELPCLLALHSVLGPQVLADKDLVWERSCNSGRHCLLCNLCPPHSFRPAACDCVRFGHIGRQPSGILDFACACYRAFCVGPQGVGSHGSGLSTH